MLYKSLIVFLLFMQIQTIVWGQSERKASIGLNVFANSTSAPKMIPDYELSPKYQFTGGRAPGFEAQLFIGYQVIPRLEMRAGFVLGVQAQAFNIYIDTSFLTLFSEPFDDYYLEFDNAYWGWFAKARYTMWQNQTNAIGATAGLRAIYFGRYESSFSLSASTSGSISRTVYSVKAFYNPANKTTYAPEFGVFYSRKLNNRFKIGMQLETSFSKTLIMASESSYTIHGNSTQLHGQMTRSYQQIGVGFDLVYLFEP